MISYTLTPVNLERADSYGWGFRVADTDDVARLINGISRFVWSGIVWQSGRRLQARFLSSDWCVLDFDTPEMTLAQAVNAFCDCRHIIGTTKSHQKEKQNIVCDRFRVVIAWERRIISLDEYRYNMRRMLDNYPIDRKCLDGARYFYPCQEIVSFAEDGYRQEVHAAPAESETPRTRRTLPGVIPPWARSRLQQHIPIGDRNQTFFRVSKDLMRAGFGADETYDIINKRLSGLSSVEIATLVGSARKSVEMEMADGRKEARSESQGYGGGAPEEAEEGEAGAN